MKTKKLPKSVRIHIRKEKERIRNEKVDEKEKQKMIEDLYKKFLSK